MVASLRKKSYVQFHLAVSSEHKIVHSTPLVEYFYDSTLVKIIFLQYNYTSYHLSGCGAVDSALGLGPRGRRFESFHPDQLK